MFNAESVLIVNVPIATETVAQHIQNRPQSDWGLLRGLVIPGRYDVGFRRYQQRLSDARKIRPVQELRIRRRRFVRHAGRDFSQQYGKHGKQGVRVFDRERLAPGLFNQPIKRGKCEPHGNASPSVARHGEQFRPPNDVRLLIVFSRLIKSPLRGRRGYPVGKKDRVGEIIADYASIIAVVAHNVVLSNLGRLRPAYRRRVAQIARIHGHFVYVQGNVPRRSGIGDRRKCKRLGQKRNLSNVRDKGLITEKVLLRGRLKN